MRHLHFNMDDLLQQPNIKEGQVVCFKCGAELDVSNAMPTNHWMPRQFQPIQLDYCMDCYTSHIDSLINELAGISNQFEAVYFKDREIPDVDLDWWTTAQWRVMQIVNDILPDVQTIIDR